MICPKCGSYYLNQISINNICYENCQTCQPREDDNIYRSPDEIFKQVDNYNNIVFYYDYYISNYGEVYNKTLNKIHDYKNSSLCLKQKNGNNYNISRADLVLYYFDISYKQYECYRKDKKKIYGERVIPRPIKYDMVIKTHYVKLGYIYCLSNPSFHNLYKIGFTTTSIKQRLSELSNTSVPFDFKCEFFKKVSNCSEKERQLHNIFSKDRVNSSREFFRTELSKIKDAFDLMEY